MAQAGPGRDGLSAEEALALEQERETQRDMRSKAAQMGDQQSLQEMVGDEDLLDVLLDFDISRGEDDDLPESLSSELSNKYLIANMTAHEVEKMQTWTDSEAQLKVHEHPSRDSLATGTRGQIMYGEVSPAEMAEMESDHELDGVTETGNLREEFAPKPPLTAEMERRIWRTADVKKSALTLSKNGRLLRALTEFVAVGIQEKRESEEDSGGVLSGLKNRII